MAFMMNEIGELLLTAKASDGHVMLLYLRMGVGLAVMDMWVVGVMMSSLSVVLARGDHVGELMSLEDNRGGSEKWVIGNNA